LLLINCVYFVDNVLCFLRGVILKANPNPSDDEIVKGLEGNLCRCTGYVNIVKSVKRAAEVMKA
jgi:carbon-monoxide dehydrogenase small subunit